jgi:copper(I)-binding protein
MSRRLWYWCTARGLGVVLVVLTTGLPASSADNTLGVMVHDAWIREAPPISQTLAGYVSLENRSSQGYTLVGASSPDFERVMLHETEIRDGVARMAHRAEVRIAAGNTAVFTPGGLHLMLMQPKRTFRIGDRVSVELLFSDGRRLSVDFEVRQEPPH